MIIQEAEDFFTLKNLDTKLKEIKDYVKRARVINSFFSCLRVCSK